MADRGAVQVVGHACYLVGHGERGAPLFGYAGRAVVCAGELAVDRRGGVRVVAEVRRHQRAFAEVVGVVERPQRRLHRLDDVTRPRDVRRPQHLERSVGHRRNAARRFGSLPQPLDRRVAIRKQRSLVRAVQRPDQQASEVAAGVHGLVGAVRGAGAVGAARNRGLGIGGVEHRHRGQPHQGAVTRRPAVRGRRSRDRRWRSKRLSASETVLPMSKQNPVDDM